MFRLNSHCIRRLTCSPKRVDLTSRKGLLFMHAQLVTFSQDFFHHGDTICHPKSSYITTKLNGMSTCGCNNNAICSHKAMFHVSYRRRVSATLNWPRQSTGGACQSSEMAALLNSLAFVLNNLFLHKYSVKHYHYNLKSFSSKVIFKQLLRKRRPVTSFHRRGFVFYLKKLNIMHDTNTKAVPH